MSFRRSSYFNPLPSRRVFNENMLIEPWIDEPVLPLFGTRPFNSLMSSVLDVSQQGVTAQAVTPSLPAVHLIEQPKHFSNVFVQILEPFALLDRMDRMINRWIGGAVRRRVIRRRRPQLFRRIRPTIPAAPIRRARRGKRQQRVQQRVQRPVQPRVQPMREQLMRQRPVSQPVQPQRMERRRSRSVSVRRPTEQPTWQQPQFGKQIGGIRKQQQQRRQPSFGRQVPIGQMGRQPMQQQRLPQPQQQQQQPFGQMGKQLPIQTGKQQQVKRSTSQQRLPSLGRQVPIQQQQVKRQQQQQQLGTSSGIGKVSKAAEPVTGVKLPQLYRICLNARECNPKDIRCNIQPSTSGQCNIIITGCGPYRRCYTLPTSCDSKKMKKYVTPENMYVIECPLVETPRCLDISTQPQIKEDCVSLKVNIPEFIDPNKVQVNLKENDLILRFETKLGATEDVACRVHYYNKVTLPAQTNLDMLKCQCVRGCLCITAPIIGGKKQQKQPQLGRQVGGVSGREERGEISGVVQPEKKMRHRKQLKMQQEEQQRGVQKGVQPTTKVSGEKKQKLPKPEEISIGREQKKQPTGKQAPGAPVTPSTMPGTKQKKQKQQQREPTETQRVPGAQEMKPEGAKPGKKGKKGMKGQQEGTQEQQEQQGRISDSQRLHEIFASSGTTPLSEQREQREQRGQREQPEKRQEQSQMSSEGRPVSPTKQ